MLLPRECKIKRVGLQAKNQSHDKLEEGSWMIVLLKRVVLQAKINLMI